MSAETRKVLEMLAEGKITSEDAERLLDKLAAVKEPAEGNGEAKQEGSSAGKGGQKFLRIVVTRDMQGHDVNMRIPLNFVRSGVKLVGVLPLGVAEKLSQHGFDVNAFSAMHGDELNQALHDLNLDIDSDGKHVRIFCE